MARPPPFLTAAEPGLSSEQIVTEMELDRVIIVVTVDVPLELSRNIAQPPCLPTQKRLMAMMPGTWTMMSFLHAGIPSVTAGSTTALMLFSWLGTTRSLLLFVSKACLPRCSFVDFRSLYRPLSCYAQLRIRLGALQVSPSICLNLITILEGWTGGNPHHRAYRGRGDTSTMGWGEGGGAA